MSTFFIEFLIKKPCPVCGFHGTRMTESFEQTHELISADNPDFKYATFTFKCQNCKSLIGIIPKSKLQNRTAK